MAQSPTRAAPSRRGIVKAVAALAAGIAAPAVLRVRAAYAAYPDRPIKFVVANTPGGPSDIVGRLVAAALQQSTGKTFIIENRGGAGGNLGMEYVAHSDPDGYTLLLGTTAFSVNYSLYNSAAVRLDEGFRRGQRCRRLAQHLSGQAGSAGEDDEGFRRARPFEPRKIQRLGAADRHDAAITDGAAEGEGETAEPRRGGVQGRRRRSRGAACRHRADLLRLGGALGGAHQGAARCAGSRSAPSSAGPICPTCRP